MKIASRISRMKKGRLNRLLHNIADKAHLPNEEFGKEVKDILVSWGIIEANRNENING